MPHLFSNMANGALGRRERLMLFGSACFATGTFMGVMIDDEQQYQRRHTGIAKDIAHDDARRKALGLPPAENDPLEDGFAAKWKSSHEKELRLIKLSREAERTHITTGNAVKEKTEADEHGQRIATDVNKSNRPQKRLLTVIAEGFASWGLHR